MPTDTLRQITGTFAAPDGTVYANQTLTWFRARRKVTGQGSTTVLDQPFYVTTDAGGDVDDNVMAGNYLVLAALSDGDRYFNVAVPDEAGPHNVADLVDTGPVDDSIVTQVQALVLKARAWAENAEDEVVDPDNYPGEYSARHHAIKAAASAAGAALYDGPTIPSHFDIESDTSLTMTAGQPGTVVAGDIVRARAEGTAFVVVISDGDRTTGGGVALDVAANSEGRVTTGQFGQSDVSTDPGQEIQAAYDAGFRDVVITGAKAVFLSASYTLEGMTVRGNGHRISPNGGQLKGCKLIEVIHDKDPADYFRPLAPPVPIPSSVRPKIVHRAEDTPDGYKFLVISCGAGGRYRLDNIETGNGADDWDANHEFARVISNVEVRHAFVCLNTFTPSSASVVAYGGGIEGVLFGTSGLTALDSNGVSVSNTIQAYEIPDSGGEYVEYDIAADNPVEEWNIAYYATGLSSDDIGIYVDDVLVDSFSAKNAVSGQTVKVRKISVPRRNGSTRKLRIQNDGIGTFYFVCANFFLLDQYPGTVPVDTWKIWIDSFQWFNTEGASDYALQPASGGTFIGSYHGGETSSYLRWIAGRNVLNPASGFSAGDFYIGDAISLKQRTTLDAGADGSLDIYSTTLWHADGQYTLRANAQGEMDVNFAYTCMTPANSDFDFILQPFDYWVANGDDYQPLGDYNDVIQYDNSSLYFLRTTTTLFDPSKNSYGGPVIWNNGTQYKKLYYGPIVQNRGSVKELSWETTREFGFGKY